VIGGYVYRGTKYTQLQGYYICADYVKTNAWKIKRNNSGGWNVYLQQGVPGSLVSFGEDQNGELYASTRTGDVYRVTALNNFVESGPGISNTNAASFVYPTLVDNNSINILLNGHYNYVRIVDMNGRELAKKDISGATGKISLHLPRLAAGTYIVQLVGHNPTEQRIYIAK
jgi:hypothetical protein